VPKSSSASPKRCPRIWSTCANPDVPSPIRTPTQAAYPPKPLSLAASLRATCGSDRGDTRDGWPSTAGALPGRA
jgi:hypothetical protein